jgi:hypothetical protein
MKKITKKTPEANDKSRIASSFRDPSGFVYKENGEFFRQINKFYKEDYELLINSGLYDELVSRKLLISHVELDKSPGGEGYKIIKPDPIPFISYFYEWSFSMLKDAAILTLEIQKAALVHGMSLKDASAFNVQFLNGHPILIDSLSFEKYEEGKPWVAYKQFVEHFLSPLSLMSYVDVRLGRLGEIFLNGIPVDLAASLLPLKSRLNLRLLFHVFAHASSQKKHSGKGLGKNIKEKKFGKRALFGLIDNLEGAVKSLKWKPEGTQWEDYYEEDKNNYKSESFRHKGELVKKFVGEVKPETVWDMGANTGHFSKIAASLSSKVISFDIDYGAIEKNYLELKETGEQNILPLFSDLTNPASSVGWEGKERMSIFERGPADLVMALAFIHHLAIPHNIPFSYLAETFSKMGKNLIIEFIEKDDSQAQILLSTRRDIFPNYNRDNFEKEFEAYFKTIHKVPIKGSKRTLYLMETKI